MGFKSWQVGSLAEKRVQKLIEDGEYDGESYRCHRFTKVRFASQDLYGADIVCVNEKHWLLCQVKYLANRKPPLTKQIKDELLADPKPDCTKHVVARIDGRTQEITWDEL